MIDVNELIKLTGGQEQLSAYKLGTIVNGKVQFDGEDIPSEKTYMRLDSYTVTSADRVLLAVVGGTYIILGRVI